MLNNCEILGTQVIENYAEEYITDLRVLLSSVYKCKGLDGKQAGKLFTKPECLVMVINVIPRRCCLPAMK